MNGIQNALQLDEFGDKYATMKQTITIIYAINKFITESFFPSSFFGKFLKNLLDNLIC